MLKFLCFFSLLCLLNQVDGFEADSPSPRSSQSPSCKDRCEEYYDSNNYCQCNDRCREFGNCCDDFFSHCATEDSCENRCNEQFNASLPCHCEPTCLSYENCCIDFISACNPITSCEDRCYEDNKPEGATCSCDQECKKFNNCCDNYDELCDTVEKYLCLGNCNVTRTRCDCTTNCTINKNCCSDYQETCNSESAWVDIECSTEADMKCPTDFVVPPVILFSIDGFKAEYIYREKTPNIWKLANCGVHAPYMRSIYPTKTFPNHYTLATGLYPESHGIIDNTMYDFEHDEEFRLGSPNSFHPFWWGGEPIWVTTSNQGKKSACYFWPGSDVNITRYPDYYYKYDGSVDNEERMYQALDWLDMPAEDRPSFITLYMDIVDHAGHAYGPDSAEVNVELSEVDRVISILMNGLKLRGLENCVNIIMVADHGMAPISCDRKTNIEDYGINMDAVYFRSGAMGRLGKSTDPSEWDLFDDRTAHNKLKCHRKESHWQSFLKYEYSPKRHHYANNDRIEPVLLQVDDTWLVEGKKGSNNNCNGGTHGYDNEFASMHSLFAAHGPGFKRGYNTTKPFENIEVYNLMTDLLEITPAGNNGTIGSLYHIMQNPKKVVVESAGMEEGQCPFPDKDVAEDNLGCIYCQGLSEEAANKRLDFSNEQANDLKKIHLIFGMPKITAVGNDNVDYCVLAQFDYVTAYDNVKKMPLFVSYILHGDKNYDYIPLSKCSRPDIRISKQTTFCSDYTSEINPQYLIFPELLLGDAKHDAAITSNLVPMYQTAETVWRYMGLVLGNWAKSYGGLNVISGPIFDYNFDGFPDTMEELQQNGTFLNGLTYSTPVPTHYFFIISRCVGVGMDISNCGITPDSIEFMSFIIPNYIIEPCHKENEDLFDWVPTTLAEHVARVKDIEILTGMSFFSMWTQSTNPDVRQTAVRAKLALPQYSSQWFNDFLTVEPLSGQTTPPPVTTTSGQATFLPSVTAQVLVFLLSLCLFN